MSTVNRSEHKLEGSRLQWVNLLLLIMKTLSNACWTTTEWNVDAKDEAGTTPLMLAVRLEIDDLVCLLLEKEGIDENAVDKKGKIALHRAAAVNNKNATLMLLNAGR